MDIDTNRLYWVNAGSATMQYLDLATEKYYTVRRGGGDICNAPCQYDAFVKLNAKTEKEVGAKAKRPFSSHPIRVIEEFTFNVVMLWWCSWRRRARRDPWRWRFTASGCYGPTAMSTPCAPVTSAIARTTRTDCSGTIPVSDNMFKLTFNIIY